MSATVERPSLRERGRLRRRARYLRRLRELQLRDLGGLVLELRRAGREREDLVAAKAAVLEETDTELGALERILGALPGEEDIREPGIGGTCSRCHAVHGSADAYCSACGRHLRAET
jgi:hypothetical protein